MKSLALLEIGKHEVKVAVVGGLRGRPSIQALIQRTISSEKEIAEIFKQEKVTFDRLIISLSRDQVILRNLELPTTDPQEIKDIINLQAGKQTPFSKEEILFDFEILGSFREHYTQVLLAIVPKSIIHGCLAHLFPSEAPDRKNSSGNRAAVQNIVVSSECFINWYPRIRPRIGAETFVVLDFDRDFSELCVLSKEKLLFTRMFPLGLRHLSEGSARERYGEEIRLSLHAYQEENMGPPWEHVIFMGGVSGDDAALQDLKNRLEAQFSLKTSGPFDERGEISFSEKSESVLAVEKRKGFSFSKLIGLALNPQRSFMDFMPSEIKQKRLGRSRGKRIIATGSLFLALVILVLGIFAERIYTKMLFLQRIDSQLVKMEKGSKELRDQSLRINLIKDRMNMKYSAIEVLGEIHRSIPSESYMKTISFDEGEWVSLTGTSTSLSAVFKLVKTLEDLPMFKGVKTKQLAKRRIYGAEEITDFEIICPIAKNGE